MGCLLTVIRWLRERSNSWPFMSPKWAHRNYKALAVPAALVRRRDSCDSTRCLQVLSVGNFTPPCSPHRARVEARYRDH